MLVKEIFGLAVAIVALAAFTSAISPHSHTNQILNTLGSQFSSVLGTAISPVTG